MTLEKPKNVVLAIQLLWGSIALYLINMPFRWTEALEKITHQTPQLPLNPVVFIVLVWGSTLATFIWLTLKISAGRNWARIVYLVLTVIGVPLSAPAVINQLNTSLGMFLLALLATLLSVVICVLLFTPPSNAWYRELKAQRRQKKS